MATRFRLTSSTTAPAVSPAFQSYTHANGTRRRLVRTDSSTLTTTAQTPDAADHLVAGDTSHVQFVSDPLPAGVVFNGATVQYAVQGLEANAANNLFVQLFVSVVSEDGATVRATLLAKTADGTELGTSLASRGDTQSLGNYTTQSGERLVVEFALAGTPTATSGTQGHNGSLRWGGAGAGGDLSGADGQTGTTLNPWIEFSNDFGDRVSLAGSVRAGLGRLRALGARLVYASAPLRAAAPRLVGAALATTVALSGVARAGTPRLPGATLSLSGGGTPVSLAGTVRAGTPRLRATGLALVYRAAPIRPLFRLRGATLTSTVALPGGVLRAGMPRFTGAALSLGGTTVPLAGTLRAGTPRLPGAALTSAVALTGTLRSGAPRLAGASLTTTSALAGAVRAGTPRLHGVLSFGGGTTVNLAGTLRAGAPRLRATGILLGYRAAPVRAVVRLRGAALTFAPFTVALAGRIRVGTPRLLAAEPTLWQYAAPIRAGTPRLLGALSFVDAGVVSLAGTVRTGSPRLRGAQLLSHVALKGTTRAGVPRLRGATLTTRVALTGRVRPGTPRLTGSLTFAGGTPLPIAGTLRAGTPRLRGASLTTSFPMVSLAGSVRAGTLRLRGATLTSRVVLRGTLCGVTRLPGARLDSTVAMAGVFRAGTPRLLYSPIPPTVLTGTLRVVGVYDASLAVAPALDGTLATKPAFTATLAIVPQPTDP